MLLACLLPVSALAQPYSAADLETAAKLRDAALAGSGAFELVASLTTEVGPRLAGSPGDAAAVAWAQRRLAALGLTNVRAQEVIVPHWVRGSIETRVTAPFPQALAATALGGSVGTPEEGIEAEVVAFDSVEALEAAPGESVAGRIVYLGRRTDRSREGRGYGAALPNRVQGPSEAGRKGAAALVIRSLGTSNNRLPHTGALRYTIDAPRIPAAALSNPDADLLERMLAAGEPVRLSLKLTARDLPYAKSANVIAEIPGTDLKDEVVLLGAHLDSWDLGTGAIDDGAGVAIVSAAAGLIARLGVKPRRTIRVVLFANEEFGLSGANAYANQTDEAIARHVLALEADFGGARIFQLGSAVPEDRLPQVDAMMPVLAPLGIERGGNRAFGGADLQPLRRKGVPVLGLSQDGTLYFDTHHTANDNLDKIDPAALDQAVAAYAATAFLAAQAEGGFGRLGVTVPEQRVTPRSAAFGTDGNPIAVAPAPGN
jgi:Zn-dependent M28 family amino/carboxypeptidase